MKSMSDKWPVYFPEMLHTIDSKNQVGIVTLWAKKEFYIEKLDSSLYNTIGQLYSREEGLSSFVRNLLANKNITDIVMVGVDLNNCSFALKAFFENGVDDKNEVIGCDFYSKVDDEIPIEAIDILRKNVKLHDLTKIKDKGEVNSYLKELKNENLKLKRGAYGDFELFKEAKLKIPETFPSDNCGFKSSGKYIKDVWIDILKKIDKFGYIKKTQYGDKQKELISVMSVVTHEDPDDPQWSDDFDFSRQELEDYMPQVTTPNEIEGLDYTYGQKLMKFRNIDQIANMVAELKKENYTRRALACTWDVVKDFNNPKCPCLNLVQALVQGDRLDFTCYFRSNDMYGGWPRNAFALRKLQKNISEKIGVKMGSLIIISNSAHVYERAFNKIAKLIESKQNNISWDSDPYGAILVTTSGDMIIAQHIDTNGKKLDVVEGKSAIEVYIKLAKELKVSNISHAMDIGCELQKAEIAITHGIEFVQDKPLKFD